MPHDSIKMLQKAHVAVIRALMQLFSKEMGYGVEINEDGDLENGSKNRMQCQDNVNGKFDEYILYDSLTDFQPPLEVTF